MKKLIREAWNGRHMDDNKLTQALLQYRNIPSRKDGLSPAQKLFDHPIQDIVPAHRKAFLPEWQWTAAEVEQQVINTQEAVEHTYNQHARPLPMITVGSHVAVQSHDTKLWDIYGIVTEIGPHRWYFIKTQSSHVLVRNRRFIRRCVPLAPTSGTPQRDHPRPTEAPRRSCRHQSKPKRLVEEMKSFQVRAPDDLELQEGEMLEMN